MNSNMIDEYLAHQKNFQETARRLGFDEAATFFWYHTIDLGDGLITPGIYDYRDTVGAFRFPESMRGMTVLDVGSATGFFAFEFEKRGARVISVELPSLEDLDRFPGQTTEQLLAKIERMLLPSLPDGKPATEVSGSPQDRRLSKDELYFRLLEGPFRFCHTRLQSKVERCFSAVYDLSAERLGVTGFDLIYLGDILLHTFYPWKALAAVAPLCKSGGLLVLSQVMPEEFGSTPVMHYVGGDDPQGDDISWWWPNKPCFEQLLKKMGFRTVEEVGRSRGALRSTAYPFDRTILHAAK
jgi:tRNA (mo5U34)-methyltransferase